MANLNVDWAKVGKAVVKVGVPIVTGIAACVQAVSEQKKAAEYDEMKKAFDALKSNKED
jgi:hypothetical protein